MSLLGHPVVQSAIKGGLIFNRKRNGLPVPKGKQKNGHPKYNDEVKERLDNWAEANPNHTPEEAADYTDKLASELNDDVRDTLASGGVID